MKKSELSELIEKLQKLEKDEPQCKDGDIYIRDFEDNEMILFDIETDGKDIILY